MDSASIVNTTRKATSASVVSLDSREMPVVVLHMIVSQQQPGQLACATIIRLEGVTRLADAWFVLFHAHFRLCSYVSCHCHPRSARCHLSILEIDIYI